MPGFRLLSRMVPQFLLPPSLSNSLCSPCLLECILHSLWHRWAQIRRKVDSVTSPSSFAAFIGRERTTWVCINVHAASICCLHQEMDWTVQDTASHRSSLWVVRLHIWGTISVWKLLWFWRLFTFLLVLRMHNRTTAYNKNSLAYLVFAGGSFLLWLQLSHRNSACSLGRFPSISPSSHLRSSW